MGRKTVKFEEKSKKWCYRQFDVLMLHWDSNPLSRKTFTWILFYFYNNSTFSSSKSLKILTKNLFQLPFEIFPKVFFSFTSPTWSNFIPKEKRERAHKNYAKMTLYTRNSSPSSSLLSHCIMLIWLKNYSFLAYT